MLIFPAIDIQNGTCVRLVKGDFATAQKVAEDAVCTAKQFEQAGAQWIHMVDLDGAKDGLRRNAAVFESVAAQTSLNVEVGGGIRSMQTLETYFSGGIRRCILGSAALKDPAFVREAAAAYGSRIAVGIDAVNGLVATEGWLDVSRVSYLELAKQMEKAGVQTLIFTDISKDGTLAGPNLQQLKAISETVSCNIVASGGIRDRGDIEQLTAMGLYGAICGKSLYSGTLSLTDALDASRAPGVCDGAFEKSALVPTVVQQADTGEVLMLAYSNRTSLYRTLETGTTWFWSRSRREYWNKGATSGHVQKVVSVTADCDLDTLLFRVDQTGPACHTGAYSCFFNQIADRPQPEKE